ncbi:MAG: hypothetical protein M3P24_07375 [Gemmatimonadota bacterium]|nr:hypothetical protein [Gemmatimonadota bacterium]
MVRGAEPTRGVLVRDLFLFQIKLFLDSLKDLALLQASFWAALVDLVFIRHTHGRCFYAVLRASERVDLWLNLYGASKEAGRDSDGLFGTSRAGEDTFLGKLEELVRQREAVHRAAPPGAARHAA